MSYHWSERGLILNRTSGYLLALCAGVSLGWLAQQFWFAGLDQQVSSSQRDLLRNEQRLKNLRSKEQNLKKPASLDSVDSTSTKTEITDIELLADQLENKAQLSETDFQVIFSVAKQKLAQGNVQDAIVYLYDLRLLVDSQFEDAYLNGVQDFVLHLEQTLEKAGEHDLLIASFRQLVSFQPEYTPYYLSLAHWLIVSEEWDEAELSLVSARHDLKYGEEVQLLENTIAELRDRSSQYIVPLQTVGEHYLLELLVNDEHSLSLMIDTGASMTVVKTEFVQEYLPSLLDEADELLLKTANGSVKGSKVQVGQVSLGGLSMVGVTLGVLPLSDFTYDGLLGMDILKRFEFKIDQENQQLVLNPQL